MPYPRRRPVAPTINTWSIPCFGGPLHGNFHDVEEGDTSFNHAHCRVAMTRGDLRPMRVNRCSYQVVEHCMEGPSGYSRRVRSAIYNGSLSREELVAYRDRVHDEFRDFQAAYQADEQDRYLGRWADSVL